MNKTPLAFTLAAMLLAGLASPLRAGVGFSIGANAWYVQWIPAWSDGKLFLPPGTLPENGNYSTRLTTNTFKTDPAFLYGPSLALSIKRMNITSVFMYGRLNSLSTGPFASDFFLMAGSRYHRTIDRFDSDSTIGYRVHDAVRLFLGFKYQGYRYLERVYYVTVTPGMEGMYNSRGRATMDSFGPGLGVGFTIPLHRNLFLLNTLSASCLFGSEKYRIKRHIVLTFNPAGYFIPLGQFSGEKFYSITGNGSLALAYYIEKAGLTLALGFRYQGQFYLQNPGRGRFYNYNHKFDHSYGATVSLTYSFSAGKGGAPEGGAAIDATPGG